MIELAVASTRPPKPCTSSSTISEPPAVSAVKPAIVRSSPVVSVMSPPAVTVRAVAETLPRITASSSTSVTALAVTSTEPVTSPSELKFVPLSSRLTDPVAINVVSPSTLTSAPVALPAPSSVMAPFIAVTESVPASISPSSIPFASVNVMNPSASTPSAFASAFTVPAKSFAALASVMAPLSAL